MNPTLGGNWPSIQGSWDPRRVGLARAGLRKALAGWGLSELEDSASLVLSELLTNAARHARVCHDWEIETRYLPDGTGTVRIEVHDASPSRPQVRDADPDSLDGRGLILVAALADEWGVTERDDGAAGKVVWARLSLPAATDTDTGAY